MFFLKPRRLSHVRGGKEIERTTGLLPERGDEEEDNMIRYTVENWGNAAYADKVELTRHAAGVVAIGADTGDLRAVFDG